MADKLTRETAENQICAVLENQGMIEIPKLLQELKWDKKEKTSEIRALFDATTFTEVLAQIPVIEITKNDKGTAYVRLAQNADIGTRSNAKTEETMAHNTNIHDRIEKLRDALSDGLYEKEEAVRLSLLAAVAGESVFFLGAPGCAKSMIARRIAQAFKADEQADGDKMARRTKRQKTMGESVTLRRCSTSFPRPRTCSAPFRSRHSTASLRIMAIKKSTSA